MFDIKFDNIINYYCKYSRTHLISLDNYTRIGLILTGALGAYALGANNIANVMGAFINSNPFNNINFDFISLNKTQVLFLIGGIAISVGIFTYSHKVIATIGNNLMSMSPQVAWIIVFSQSLVLFIFSSQGLQNFLISHNLPTIPLVPVSSTQAVIGSIIGIGLIKGGRDVKWGIVGQIALGWLTTPIIAGTICFISLFFLENVFNLTVYH